MLDADIVTKIIGVSGYVQAVTFLLTVIAPTVMVAISAPRRDRFALRATLCAVGLAVFSELYTLATELILRSDPALVSYILYFLTLKFFLTFVLSGVCVKLTFDVDWWNALFCVTAGYCLQHIQAKIGAIIVEFIIGVKLYWVYETIINMAIAAIFYAVVYAVFFRKHKHAPYTINNVQVAISACVVGVNIFYNSFGIAYLSTLVIDMQSAGLDTSVADKLMIFIYIISMIVAALALILDFGVSKNRQLADENAALDKVLEEGKRQYEYEKSNMELINIKCHDLKHQLAAMKGKIYEEQIDELSSAIDIYDSSIKTGNDALDVLFTQKSFYCGGHGIRLTCLLNGENYDFVPRHELYSLFSNAVDNAIEAVEKLPEEKRVISVTETVAGDMVVVHIENYYDGKVELRDGLPRTSKADDGHGYGVKSIKMIAEKNGGGISISADGELFKLDIHFAKSA